MLSPHPRRSVLQHGGGSMARVWGAAAPARLALLLLLVATCSQETGAAPWRAPADDADAPYPEDWVDIAFVPQENPRGLLGELAERSPVAEPGLDARGPEIWKETSRTGKYPQRLSHVLKKIMKEKAAQVLLEPQEALYNWIRGFFLKNPGVDEEGRANAEQVKDAQKLYLELASSVPVSLLLTMILCCILFWWCRKRKQRLAAADGVRDDSSSYSSPSEEESADLEWPDRRTNHQPSMWQQPAHQPQGTSRAAPARLDSSRAQLPPPRPPRPPSPGSASRGISNRPSSPWPQWASMPPPHPPPPSFKGQKEPAGGGGLRSSASTEPIAPQQMSDRPSSPQPQRASTPPPPSPTTILQGTGAVSSACRLSGIVQHLDNHCLGGA
ncbi:uncharacterized protein LOC125703681 isoform X2 [Lagopus muta]|uniref:uncharacterized protein LOC125703681 isoform X2 n=1 Tax=Lagopus muta TaxID=64668 RepID=UPI0020A08C01|nr:uncharacterized protein LOC125703681 isoform X2 [Lagopus muta]